MESETPSRRSGGENGDERPLSGLRVLSLEQAVAAPLCTQHLVDLGADVIKIERPGGGDFARSYDSAVAGESAWFYWLNRGKRSLALDVKHGRAQEILRRLLARADVFVQNLGPGAAERQGLGAVALRGAYPRLIVCSISGYGAEGPYRGRKAYDALLQGETGVMALTGMEGAPARAGISVADIAAGMYSLSSILAALYRRRDDDQGSAIEVSLFDALSQWVSPALYGFLATGSQPRRAGMRHSNIVPYGLFSIAEGRQINLAVQNEREWERFCAVVLRNPELASDVRFNGNERRLRNRAVLEPLIEQELQALRHEEAVERLEAADVPWGEYRDVAALADHPQLRERGRLLPSVRPDLPPVMAHPMNLERLRQQSAPVPRVGEQSRAILSEVGYQNDEIDGLAASGVVQTGA